MNLAYFILVLCFSSGVHNRPSEQQQNILIQTYPYKTTSASKFPNNSHLNALENPSDSDIYVDLNLKLDESSDKMNLNSKVKSKDSVAYVLPEKFGANEENQTVTGQTNSFMTQILSKLDSQAKEIILLSTVCVTMLLSTCFLVFIIWFCCCISYSDRHQRKQKQPPKHCFQENETQTNTHIILKQLDTNKDPLQIASEKTVNNLKVKDDIIENVNRRCSTMVEDYTDLKEEELFSNKTTPDFVNQAYTSDVERTPKNFHLIRDLPQLTSSQIEKDFNRYTLDCRRRYEKLLKANPDRSGSNTVYRCTTTTKTINRLGSGRGSNLGTYGKNHRKRKEKMTKISTSFSEKDAKGCGVESKVQIFKLKPRTSEAEQVWRI